MGKLPYGCDLLNELTDICKKKNILTGKIEGIGAVQCATIGYYNQQQKEYIWNKINRPMEVLSLKGNISIKDNQSFVHAHVVLGDSKGEVYGGHLNQGTIVFAFEYIIIPFEGEQLIRGFDDTTSLFLWK